MSDLDFENRRCGKALCRIAEGDCSALDVIYETLGRRIYFLALAMLRNDSDAEDVLGETLLEVIGGAARFERGSNARAWVLAIAKNLSLKKLRDRGRTTPLDDAPEDAWQSDDGAFAGFETLELTRVLEPTDRKIVLLRYYGGYKINEIADMLGLTPECVKKRSQRAVKKLSEEFSEKP